MKKPKAVKKLEGTYREDRDGGRNPEPEKLSKYPEPPRILNRYGKAAWRKMIPTLVDLGLVTTVDLPVLENAFVCYGEARQLQASINDNYKSLSGYLWNSQSMRYKPLYKSYLELTERFNTVMYKFGVTPLERERITIESTKAEDTLDKMLSDLMNKPEQ